MFRLLNVISTFNSSDLTTVCNIHSILLFLVLTTDNCIGQNNINGIPEERQKQLDTLILLIKKNNVTELADRVLYPIKRPNPVPDIHNKSEFIRYYPTLFDSAYKAKLIDTKFESTNTIDHLTGFGLFRGDIWLYDDGRIMTVNYQSPAETQLIAKLQLETEKRIHSSVKPWKKNIIVCETEIFLVRIDLMEDNTLRYISWKKPKQISDEPDLILFNGVQEFQGTKAGVTYTFQNNDRYYQVAEVDMAESDDKLGFFLRIYKSKNDLENYNAFTNNKCYELK